MARSLAAIEIWNEPDQANQNYFAGPEKPQRYAAILRAAYPAIKQVDPAVPVLAGSLVGSNGLFLRALYAAGIKGYYDGLSVHFYNLVLASRARSMKRSSPTATPRLCGSTSSAGAAAGHGRRSQQEQGCVTRAAQGENLADIFHSLAHTPWVAANVVYDLQGSQAEDFGALSASGARKPAFFALSRVMASPFGNARPVTLRLSRHSRRVVATGSGPVGDYMELEVFRGRTLRYRALFTLNRFNRYSLALPRKLGTTRPASARLPVLGRAGQGRTQEHLNPAEERDLGATADAVLAQVTRRCGTTPPA